MIDSNEFTIHHSMLTQMICLSRKFPMQKIIRRGPMNRGTRPQPAKTAAIPGLAAEHRWIAEVCTAPGGLRPVSGSWFNIL